MIAAGCDAVVLPTLVLAIGICHAAQSGTEWSQVRGSEVDNMSDRRTVDIEAVHLPQPRRLNSAQRGHTHGDFEPFLPNSLRSI